MANLPGRALKVAGQTLGAAFTAMGQIAGRYGRGLTLVPHYLANLLWLLSQRFLELAREGYGNNAAVYACLRLLSQSVPEPPLIAYQVDAKGEVGDPLPWLHPLRRLIREPNELLTEYEFWELATLHLGIIGRFCCYKERDNVGRIIALWPLRPDRVGPIYSTDDAPGQKVLKGWSYLVPGTTEYVPLRRADIFFVNLADPAGDAGGLVEGLGPLQVLASEVGADNEATRFVGALMANYAMPGAILSTKKEIHDEETARLIKAGFMREFGGTRRGMPGVVDAETTVTAMGFNLRELEFPDVRAVSESRIAAAFGVPAILVGLKTGLESGIRATISEQREYFAQTTLSNYWVRFQSAYTRDVAREFGAAIVALFDLAKVKALANLGKYETERLADGFAKGAVMVDEYRTKVLQLPEIGTDYGRAVLIPTTSAPAPADGALEPNFYAETSPGGDEFEDSETLAEQRPRDAGQDADDGDALADDAPPKPPPAGGRPTATRNPGRATAKQTPRGSPADVPPRKGYVLVHRPESDRERARSLRAQLDELLAFAGQPAPEPALKAALPHRKASARANALRAVQAGADHHAGPIAAELARLGNHVAARVRSDLGAAIRAAPRVGDYVGADDTATLKALLGHAIQDGLQSAYQDAAGDLRSEIPFDPSDPKVQRELARVDRRVALINRTTRKAVRAAIAAGKDAGQAPAEIADAVEALDVFSADRARAIVRTETATAYNRGSILAYRASGSVGHVEVLDGHDFDDACAAADGQVWTLARAFNNPLQHPNCTRAFAAITSED